MRRLFLLAAAAPLSVFTLLHVILYFWLATKGAFAEAPSWLAGTPYLIVEALFIWLPLTFHASVGIWLLSRRDERAKKLPLAVQLSRISGVLAVAFVAYHWFCFRYPLLTQTATSADIVQSVYTELSSTSSGIPLSAIFHILGVAVTAFHLGFSLYIHQTEPDASELERSSAVPAWRAFVAVALGISVFVMGSISVIRIAAGSLLP